MIKVAVKNQSKGITKAEIEAMLPAFTQQWNEDLASVWSVDKATFSLESGALPEDAWWLIFLDTSDEPGALAYHDLTTTGLPLSKVFVKTILDDKASVSVGATHELCEMAVDPWLNSAYQDPRGMFWAGEVCDPVEDDQYGYKIGDILVTDFVTPDWFAHQYSQPQIDFKNHAHAPFAVLTGGYAQYFDPHRGWVQVTGHKAAASKRAQAAHGSRRDKRQRQYEGGLLLSEVK
jgi:hypothetical protein